MSYGITITMVDESLISGSGVSDPLKRSQGTSILELERSDYYLTEYFGSEQYFVFDRLDYSSEKNWWYPKDNGLAYFYSNTGLIEETNDLSFFNSYKMACRITENLDFNFENENHWKNYVLGGDYGDDAFSGVISIGALKADHSVRHLYMPYSNLDVNYINYAAGTDQAEYNLSITPYYRRHYRTYNEYASTIASERLLPNCYLLQTLEDEISAETEPGLAIKNIYKNNIFWRYVSLEEAYPNTTGVNVYDLLDPVSVNSYLPSIHASDPGTIGYQADDATYGTGYTDDQFQDIDLYLRNYFSSSLPQMYSNISASVIDPVDVYMKTIMFDEDARQQQMVTMEDNISKFPMYVHINFESLNQAQLINDSGIEDTTAGWPFTRLGELISNNNYSAKFLTDLKHIFTPGERTDLSGEITVNDMSFKVRKTYNTSSVQDRSTYSSIDKITTQTFRTIDFSEFLTYSYVFNSQKNGYERLFRVGGSTVERDALNESILTTAYNHYNTVNMSNLIVDMQDLFRNELQSSYNMGMDPETAASLVIETAPYASSPTSMAANRHKHVETLAYRVEKVSTNTTTPGGSPSVIQNFWIFEGKEMPEISLYDTQVKYGVDYTYNVYAYVIVAGHKYSITDFVYSKPIGIVDEKDENYPGYHCIQWFTEDDTPSVPLFDSTGTAELAEINTFADETMGISENYKYMADFNLNFEPSVKIIEIPLGSKTCSVIDNPANHLEINPFQLLDNSQRIGFSAEYDSFSVQNKFPKSLTLEDEAFRTVYNRNLDLIDVDAPDLNQIDRKSISKQKSLQIFRLDKKPKSLMDFDNKIISTIDLSIENSTNMLSHTIFYDKIHTNKKYYYVFRFVNEADVHGYMSHIYELELIDDGSFKYSIVDALMEQELEVNTDFYTLPSKSFKKLFMVKPSRAQMSVNSNLADLNNSSVAEIDNVEIGDSDLIDTIWGQTFKFRLTSKKTGKKIDINITYKNVVNSE
tara:strand:+ start:931 stop:3870 length:2940 start_codon:yes stop_codon:yes gene_type:complete